jgi:hypothetical protein
MADARITGVGSALHVLNVCDTVASDVGVLNFVIRLGILKNAVGKVHFTRISTLGIIYQENDWIQNSEKRLVNIRI